jgi:hypothetical protein
VVIGLKKNIVKCPCGARAYLRPASAVHGENARTEYLYVCSRYPACDSYVGVHQKSRKPLGTLADGDLRNARIRAHRAFDRLWKSGLMKKWQAYKWLQAALGLNSGQAHIGQFSAYMCDRVIALSDRAMECCKQVS